MKPLVRRKRRKREKNPDHVGVIVANTSRYANSQNKVNEADLLANDAFHQHR